MMTKHAPDRPTVPEVLPLVHAVYRRHSAGCCLHVVLDDRNLDDCFVESAIGDAIREGHTDCEKLARKLATMSRTQRGKLSARAHDEVKKW